MGEGEAFITLAQAGKLIVMLLVIRATAIGVYLTFGGNSEEETKQ